MTVLIAECCQNHNGDRETLKRMIHDAANHGGDYAKIQGLYSAELTYRPRFEQGRIDDQANVLVIKRPYEPERERLAGLDLTPDDEQWFVDECRRAGIASMITVFTRTGLRRVATMGFDAVKIASYDCRSYPLIRETRQVWSSVFVSTGASTDEEIACAANELAGTEYSFLHCVTIYPTPLEELHLRRMAFLRRFTPRIGFSDHTLPAETGMKASKVAIALGATCVERHFTVLGPGDSKDGPVSITPAMLWELREFSQRSRPEQMASLQSEFPAWEGTLGSARRQLTAVEMLNRDYYAGRVASKVNGADVYSWEDIDLPPIPGLV